MRILLDYHTMDLVTAGQILGLLLSFVGFFIYYAKTRQGILTAKLVCDIGYFFQQIMIGAHTGAVINAIAVLRELVFYHRDTHKWASHRFWLYLFIVLMGLSPVLTWMGPVSLLPAVGSAVAVIGFYCKDPHHTRILGLMGTLPWVVYAMIMTNYGQILSGTVQTVSAILGLARDYRNMYIARHSEV